jgi:hypothetical protein
MTVADWRGITGSRRTSSRGRGRRAMFIERLIDRVGALAAARSGVAR